MKNSLSRDKRDTSALRNKRDADSSSKVLLEQTELVDSLSELLSDFGLMEPAEKESSNSLKGTGSSPKVLLSQNELLGSLSDLLSDFGLMEPIEINSFRKKREADSS